MKKIILTTVAFLAFGFANAQEVIIVEESPTDLGMSAGDMWAEGSFTYSSTSNESASLKSTLSFTPQIGDMLDDQWGVGGYLAFSQSNYNSNNSNLDNSGSWGIGAFARYYFLSLGRHKSFQAYAEAGLGYSALTKDTKLV